MNEIAITPTFFLDELKTFTETAVENLKLPCKPTKENPEPDDRAAQVYMMRLVKGTAARECAPYIIHQIITMEDGQNEGERDWSEVCVRSIFCTYDDDEQQGALSLLNLMMRYKRPLLEQVIIGNRFKINKKKKLQGLIYPDDTAPFYSGEMVHYFILPGIERKV